MTATNHVLTGSLVGLKVHQPLLAIGVAVISHFVLDAMPHYGDNSHTKKRFITVLVFDILFAILILLAVAIARPLHWQLAILCGIVAASPDLMWPVMDPGNQAQAT